MLSYAKQSDLNLVFSFVEFICQPASVYS